MFFNGLTPAPEKCCGCSACVQICPKQAISWSKNDEGFNYPTVDPDKCIECGLCEKVCPMQHPDEVLPHRIGDAFGAVNLNSEELKASSSGGVFSAIADYVFGQGGIIYGAAFDKDFQLGHIGISSQQDLSLLQGSKYIQSQNRDVYKKIRTNLIQGKLVYYVGTGCQVAGLKLFLRKHYDNLITSDILCHGTPPQEVFDVVIKDLENRYNGKVATYKFRDKRVWGWSCSSSATIKKNNTLKYVGFDPILDGYFNAFIKADNYRESCYVCPFAQSKRSGDITLADFWGVEKYLPQLNARAGVSAIFINTAKGKEIINKISANLALYPAQLKDIQVINKTLVAPTPRPQARDVFFNRFQENPSAVLKSYSRLTSKKHLVYLLKKNPFTSSLITLLKKIVHK